MTEAKIPTNAKGLRIKHFASMSYVPQEKAENEKELDESESLLFLAEFTGLGYNKMLDFTVSDIKKMTATAMKALATMDLVSELPKTIKLGGQSFYLVDPEKVGIGWHIDFKKASIVKDPIRLACLFYIPEGYNYSDVDENGNIKFPIASRYTLFRDEFPLDLFIRCSNFFLKRSLTSTKRSMVREIAIKKKTNRISSGLRVLNLLNGKRLLRRS
jgi:hypothetical protein